MSSHYSSSSRWLKRSILLWLLTAVLLGASPGANYSQLDLSKHFNNDGVASLSDTEDGSFDGFKGTPGLFNYDAKYFPSGAVKVGDIPFLLGETSHGKLNNIICQKQEILVPPAHYRTLFFLGASVNGSFSAPLQLLYQEGIIENATVGFTDWCRPEPESGDIRAFSFPERVQRGATRPEPTPNFLWFAIVSVNPKHTLAAIELPDLYNLHVFAITLSMEKAPDIAPAPVVRKETPTARRKFAIATNRPGNIFRPKEKPRLKLLSSEKPSGVPLNVKLTVYRHNYAPYITKELRTRRFPLTIKLSPLENGYYPVLLEVYDIARKQRDVAWSSIACFPENKDRSPHPDSGVGMNLHLQGARGEQEARLAHDAGVSWVRVGFDWNTLEPRPGEWNWKPFDRLMARCRRYGFSVLGLFGYWPGWSEPLTEKGFQQYENYVEQVVRRYGNYVHFWEPWNEPNIFYWQGTAEQYAELLKRCNAAAKRADKSAKVVGMCAAGIGLDFMRTVLKTNGQAFCDAVSIHPYIAPSPPDKSNVPREIDEVHELFKNYGADLPIWITEVGYPDYVGDGGTTSPLVAQDLIKTYVMYGAHPHAEKIFWFCFADNAAGVPYPQDRFGIMESNLAPKPAYYVLRTMSELLKDVKSVERLPSAKHICLYNFVKEKEGILVGWSANKSQLVYLSIPAKEGMEGDFYGAERNVKGLPMWEARPEVRYIRYALH